MFFVKVVLIGLFALVAVVLGGMAAAWRRACVAITRQVHTMNFMSGDGCGSDRDEPPGPGKLSNQDIIRFTPPWVSSRHLVALTFLALTLLGAAIFFRWYVAIGVTLVAYVLMELAGFLLPRRDHPYYVWQITDSFSRTLATANRFGDQEHVAEMQGRLRELTRAYPNAVAPGETTRV